MSEVIEIIIPQYNQAELTIRCLAHLLMHTQHPYRIILSDDGSDPKEFQASAQSVSTASMLPPEIIRSDVNKGFACAVNAGLIASQSEYVCLLNNDVIVTHGWLRKLEEVLDAFNRVGAVTPFTNKICGQQLTKLPADRINNLPTGFVPHVTGSGLSYFCVLLRRQAILDVGLLHEEFYNGGEDDDYNDRLEAAGWGVGTARNCFVHHDHRATRDTVPGIKERERRNKDLLARRREERETCTSKP